MRATDAQRAQFNCEIDRHRATLESTSTSKGQARANARAFEALTRGGAAIGMSVDDVRNAITERKRSWAAGGDDSFCRAQPQARSSDPVSLTRGLAPPEGARVRMADASQYVGKPANDNIPPHMQLQVEILRISMGLDPKTGQPVR